MVPWNYTIDDGHLHNTSYILDRDRNEIGAYHKCNLTAGELQKGLSRGMTNPEDNIIAKPKREATYTVVDIDMNRIVRSDTYANHPHGENLREYLHKCRNYRAYTSLSTEGTKPLEWSEIFFKEN